MENLFLQTIANRLDPGVVTSLPDDFSLFAETYLTVRTKTMQLVPLRLNAVQRDLLPKLTGRDLIVKARQLGVSSLLQALSFHLNITQTSASVTVSDVADNTATLRAIYDRFYEKWPDDQLSLRPPRDRNSVAVVSYPLTDSESVIKTAGSKTAGRSATYSFVHGSEVAFWPDLKNTFNSVLGAAAPGAFIALESTTNGAFGPFYDLCMTALARLNEWMLHFYPWWWAPEYRRQLQEGEIIEYTEEEKEVIELARSGGFDLQPEQVKFRREKQALHRDTFAQEYAEDPVTAFVVTGGGVFDLTKIRFLPDRPEPKPGHHYSAGIDWGQDKDFSCLSIADRDENREVFLGRWRHMPWGQMRAEMVDELARFAVEIIRPERNSMGSSQIEELYTELQGRNLNYTWEILPFTTGHINKHEGVTFFRTGLEDYGYALLDDMVGKRELQAFRCHRTSTGIYTYSAAEGEHDDTVLTRILAYIGMMSYE